MTNVSKQDCTVVKYRIGYFFTLIGTILLISFFFDRGAAPRPLLFVLGTAGILIGITLVWQSREIRTSPERFRTLRRLLGKER